MINSKFPVSQPITHDDEVTSPTLRELPFEEFEFYGYQGKRRVSRSVGVTTTLEGN